MVAVKGFDVSCDTIRELERWVAVCPDVAAILVPRFPAHRVSAELRMCSFSRATHQARMVGSLLRDIGYRSARCVRTGVVALTHL